MASSFAKSLLAPVTALVIAGGAIAQSNFQEGVKHLRLGENDQALAAFKSVLRDDPSHGEALQLYRSISQDEWFLLLSQQDEIGKIAQSIMNRAKLESRERSRDESTIEALVATATAAGSGYEERRNAILELMHNHGEFAVPALAERLGDPDDDDGQIHAIAALVQMGPSVVLPLIELCDSSNTTLRLNAAAALSHIGDMRAAAVMARLGQQEQQENIRRVADAFLNSRRVTVSPVSLYLARARGYLRSGIGVGSFSDVVWSLEGDELVATDVPALVYATELAKACANDAVLTSPASSEARSVLAQANLAEANLIESSIAQGDDEAAGLADAVAEYKMAALATGPDVLRSALDEGLRAGLPSVSVGAIEALAMVEDRDGLAQSSLVRALDSSDKRVSYAAAMALVEASDGVNVPAAGKVVAALGQAVTEESVRLIQVIGGTPDCAQAAAEASFTRGAHPKVASTAAAGMLSILNSPNVDVVVINEILEDGLAENIIGNIRKDPRMTNVRVIIVAAQSDTSSAEERFDGKADSVIAGPLTGDNLLTAVDAALEDVPVEPRNTRAERYAAGASEALRAMAAGKTVIGGAVTQLAAQLDRGDSVAVPAAEALGLSGSPAQLDALLAALGGSGSDGLKVAAANAMGMILGRMADCPPQIAEGLAAAIASDAAVSVRLAVAGALGKARIDAGSKARLLDSLKQIGDRSM